MKTYKQFAEQEGVRRVDFVDGITGEKETMNEILPAIAASIIFTRSVSNRVIIV